MKRLIGAIALAAACTTVQAAPVDTGIWYSVGWRGGVGSMLTGDPVNGIDPGAAPWTITIGSGGATLTVLDRYAPGDRFSVFDGGNLVGDTSAVPVEGTATCFAPADCLADPAFSRGVFALAAGDYSFTLTLLQDAVNPVTGLPFSSGAAVFRIDLGTTTVIPVPPAAALLLSGLVGLGWFGRRKRS